jgi:hypothetical protein
MSASNAPSNYDAITKYGAWIILAVALTGAAQFDTTAQLAAAFAYLILVAAILWYGPAALTNIQSLIGTGGSSSSSTTQSTSGVTTPPGLNH